MEWHDQGYVLAARRYGEGDVILSLLTEHHGRHLGLVKGGGARAKRAMSEIGTLAAISWRARLAEQLGHFQLEPLRICAAYFMADAAKLAALSVACRILDAALPEREPHADIFHQFTALVDVMQVKKQGWGKDYVLWELALLTALGFGLDLSSCAMTGSTIGLAFVSPRTGRAATAEGAKGYESKLLPLPSFLIEPHAHPSPEDMAAGLRLTGHFLGMNVFDRAAFEGALEYRARLVEFLCSNES